MGDAIRIGFYGYLGYIGAGLFIAMLLIGGIVPFIFFLEYITRNDP